MRRICVFSGNGRKNISGDLGKMDLFTNMGALLKTQEVSIPFSKQFLKKDSLGFIMVCSIRGQLGTKVVISALGMLALYMRFNGTGIWGGETVLDG